MSPAKSLSVNRSAHPRSPPREERHPNAVTAPPLRRGSMVPAKRASSDFLSLS